MIDDCKTRMFHDESTWLTADIMVFTKITSENCTNLYLFFYCF